jgi:hypothetical protein
MIVRLKRKNARYPDLSTGQDYLVIGIEADDLRIINDQGRPYLYPPRLFRMVDPVEPDDWVRKIGDDGERYAYPAPLHRTGLFEDFFDGKKNVVAAFWRAVNKHLAQDRWSPSKLSASQRLSGST